MTFPFFVAFLVILCFFVSLIYAMTTCDSPQETVKEALWSFMLIVGGIFFLGLIVKVIPDIFLG